MWSVAGADERVKKESGGWVRLCTVRDSVNSHGPVLGVGVSAGKEFRVEKLTADLR